MKSVYLSYPQNLTPPSRAPLCLARRGDGGEVIRVKVNQYKSTQKLSTVPQKPKHRGTHMVLAGELTPAPLVHL
ncbi:hypothetical protein NIES4073_66140 [Kalymmatonema gypsitolerans NIES-4073]|nr:hypothetical protein NIES4073_66140 [Scytonema sp. NIES-4073]